MLPMTARLDDSGRGKSHLSRDRNMTCYHLFFGDEDLSWILIQRMSTRWTLNLHLTERCEYGR